jgi:hypothetical protein
MDLKLTYMPQETTVRYSSAFNPAIGDSSKLWTARDFIADATLFIPPQGIKLIRFFGLYSSRNRWRWPDWKYLPGLCPRNEIRIPGIGLNQYAQIRSRQRYVHAVGEEGNLEGILQ